MKTESKLAVTLFISLLVAANTVSAADMAAPPSANITLPSAPAFPASSPGLSQEKSMEKLEEKVTDGLKGITKQLADTSMVSLEDMNNARQAIAKLEILIDIEKKLSDLQKIKDERSGVKDMASAVPASALVPPKPAAFSPMGNFGAAPEVAPMPVVMPAPVIAPVAGDVGRIIGANGRYTAVIQDKNVQVGDKLSDGSTVTSISSSAVTVREKSGKTNILKVQGVQQVQHETF